MKYHNTLINRRLLHVFTGCMLLAVSPVINSTAQETEESEATGFSAYGLISSRNIFDPTRRPGRPPGSRPERVEPERTDRLEFVGTMIDPGDPDNAQAFFKSTEPRLQRAVKKNEAVLEYTLIEIEPTKLLLQIEGEEPVEFEKGQQFIRAGGDGAWEITASPQPFGDQVAPNTRSTRTRSSAREALTRNNRTATGQNFENSSGGNSRFGGGGNNGGSGNFFGQDEETPAAPVVTSEPIETSGASPAEILQMMRERREREAGQ